MKVIVESIEEKEELKKKSSIFRELDDKDWIIQKTLTAEEIRVKKAMDLWRKKVDAIENKYCE